MINFMMEVGYELDTPYLLSSPKKELNKCR